MHDYLGYMCVCLNQPEIRCNKAEQYNYEQHRLSLLYCRGTVFFGCVVCVEFLTCTYLLFEKEINQPVSVCSVLELYGITTGGGFLLGGVFLTVTSFGVREVGVVGLWLLPPTTPAYPEMGGGVAGGFTSVVE